MGDFLCTVYYFLLFLPALIQAAQTKVDLPSMRRTWRFTF